MKKVLIITYYWPPAGGPGVQRILKFVKYLPDFGWQPIVLTVEKGEFPAIDHSLVNEVPAACQVFRTHHLEPNLLYKSFTGMKTDQPIPVGVLAEKNLSWRRKFAHFVRHNFFIPDAKIFWKPFALRTAKEIISQYTPDVILSSSPPATVHLIAYQLKCATGLRWIADLRDPWDYNYTGINIPTAPMISRIKRDQEKKVLGGADEIITISKSFANNIKEKNDLTRDLRVITNGYDDDDFKALKNEPYFEKFTIIYTGNLTGRRYPGRFFEAIRSFSETVPELRKSLQIIFLGQISDEIRSAIDQFEISSLINIVGYVDHSDAVRYMKKSHILLLVIPQMTEKSGSIPGKVFEYLATGNPILCIGPRDSELNDIFAEFRSAKIYEYEQDPLGFIQDHYSLWKENKYPERNMEIADRFTRRSLTAKLASLFEQTHPATFSS